ncbi:HEAT repeat domain-containing protein [Leptothermofonsia sichuanensis E412]|uniref:HEAT repeat domain-containing protein n=1 Tax=Leptothermofonsia sichuanensis TaxID=2917832 RepID=UPI001CA6B44E|nr:HEAT repeat domain-containing protein [Leptothermofonsia sichuanensis]QZZ21715.1 HEAT repeat domain-containing protein [Leptothermofonsia sichuanensis E412]
MNLKAIKQQFPESASEIEALENLGFTTRQPGWLNNLDLDKAMTACWLLGKIGDDQDADVLVNLLAGQRSELWMQAAASLSSIMTQRHLSSLLSILETSSDPAQRESVVYALSFQLDSQIASHVIRVLTDIATNRVEAPSVRAQALEGLGNQLSQELFSQELSASSSQYQETVSAILQALDDSETVIRFWACFAVGRLKIEEALPKLQLLAQSDKTHVEGGWSVSEEAEDAITLINGEEPPLRQPCKSLAT